MAALAVVLVAGGGVFALWQYKQSRPHPVWVPLPLNVELPDERRERVAKEFYETLGQREFLVGISKELQLPAKLDVADDEAAADVVQERYFVEIGETETAMGKVPTVNIGVRGTNRDKKVTGEIAQRLGDEIVRKSGAPPPAGR